MGSMTSESNSIISTNQIIGAMECNTCLEVPSENPIYQCDNGHILCASCRQKLTNCPECRFTLRETRSLLSEKILAMCSRPCEFQKYGCKVKVHDMNSKEHKDACKYKPVSCIEADCDELMPLNGFACHMKDAHHVQISDNHSISCNKQDLNGNINNIDCQVATTQFSSHGYQFFTSIWLAHLSSDNLGCPGQFRTFHNLEQFRSWSMVHSSEEHVGCPGIHGGKYWLFWLYIASSSNDSRRFVYTIKVKNPGNVEEYSYTGYPIPVEANRDEVFQRCEFLVLNKSIIDRFCENGGIDIQFDIRQIETSA